MKKNFLSIKRLCVVIAGISISGSYNAQTVTNSLNFTGGIQTFTIPCGVDSVFIQAWGAQGGSGAVGANGTVLGGTGGLGGYAEGSLTVAPGDILNVFVGGQGATPTGGFNGGANGGTQNAGGGGGSSDVRVGGTSESNRVLTAGGGGGGGRGGCEGSVGASGNGGNGGNGGGGVGSNGGDSPTSGGAAAGGFGGNFGAVQGAFGPAGVGCGGFLGSPGNTSTNGTGGTGGAGQSCCCFSAPSIPGGGGGGGGQIGGGGGGGGSAGTAGCSGNDKGAGGGGGGGSSYIGGVTSGVINNGIWSGNGIVTFSYEDPTPSMAVISTAPTSACSGDTLTFTCDVLSEATFYTWTVSAGATFISGQNTNTITVLATSDFTVDVYGVNGTCSLSGPAATTINVTVLALPTVTGDATETVVCAGEPTTLTGGGADSYTWSNSVSNGVAFVPAGTATYTVTGTDLNGCENSVDVTVTVNTLPTVDINATMTGTFCGGQDVTLTGTPSGGTYTQTAGPVNALSTNIFNAPQQGNYTVSYSYTDGNGCTNTSLENFTIDCMLGLDLISKDGSMNVYPNPNNGQFTIKSDVNEKGTLELFNLSGQLVYTQEIDNLTEKTIEVKNLAPGVYTLTITSGEKKFSGNLNIIK
jgi:hypothetical protein